MSGASLLKYFEPPTDFTGYFGLVCGYEADTFCVNSMAERFCGLTAVRRSQLGHQVLVLMVDASSDFTAHTGLGVLRLPLKCKQKPPYKMLHAKVALLAFQHIQDPSRWRVRLLVSTGNWTTQTVEHSLDLMWSAEVDSTALNDSLACADIKAAWNMMQWLCTLHNTSVLNPDLGAYRISANAEHWEKFTLWLNTASKKGKGPSRFFDNRKKSFLAQLAGQIEVHAKRGRRNMLIMGSGFFEANPPAHAAPDVLQSIVSALHSSGVLFKSACVEIVVNELSCQGIAKAQESIRAQNWDIRRPTHQWASERTLHAKFLFAASEGKDELRICKNPWVYLGSGNLTHPGFMEAISSAKGNLEAGVVFEPGEMTWYPYKNYACISDFLPVAWPDDSNAPDELLTLEFGDDFPNKGPAFPAPPVSYALWEASGVRLPLQEGVHVACQIFAPDGQACPENDGLFTWAASRPAVVDIGWQEAGLALRATVPVMDEYGNVGAVISPAQSLAEALAMLGDFPLSPGSDASEDDEGEDPPMGTGAGDGAGGSAGHTATAVYPLRSIMVLVERIAEKQTALTEAEWACWCTRLEQTLVDMKDCHEITVIAQQLSINPLHALRAEPFLPAFAVDASTNAGKCYEHAIAAIEVAWGMHDKQPLGGGE